MSSTLLVILFTIAALGLFVVGMSLTLIFKGRHIDSEIGENENMKRLGIKCTAQQMREEEMELRGLDPSCNPITECAHGSCSTCGSAVR